MSLFDAKLIEDYINGEYIDEQKLEELEDNKYFMLEVMRQSKDKNFYNLCSEDLKEDYEFVKEVVNIFEKEIDFLDKVVVHKFLLSYAYDIQKLELSIIMAKLCEKNYELNIKYESNASSYYFMVLGILDEYKKEISSNNFGMGFVCLKEVFNTSEIVLNYFGRRFIQEIFDENDISLSDILRSSFATDDDLEKYGVKNFILNYIGKHDKHLSEYADTHEEILGPITRKINEIEIDMDSYTLYDEEEKLSELLDKIKEYMDENNISDRLELAFRALNRVNVLNKMEEYDLVFEEAADYSYIIDHYYHGKKEGNYSEINLINDEFIINKYLLSETDDDFDCLNETEDDLFTMCDTDITDEDIDSIAEVSDGISAIYNFIYSKNDDDLNDEELAHLNNMIKLAKDFLLDNNVFDDDDDSKGPDFGTGSEENKESKKEKCKILPFKKNE